MSFTSGISYNGPLPCVSLTSLAL